MAEALDWERKAIVATVSVFLVISAISLFIASSLADRFPLCLILSSGLTLSTARIGAFGFVTAPWQVIALYGMVFGISAGLASPPPVGVMLTRRFPNRTGFANAAVIAGLGPAGTRRHRCGAPGGASHLWIIRAILRTPYFWLLISV